MDANELLTSEELAELLSAVSGGNLDPVLKSAAPQAESATAYDFTAPRRIVPSILPRLDMINERFLTRLAPTFYNLTQQHAGLSATDVQMVTLNDYMSTLPVPCSINQIQIKPLRGIALIVFEPHLITCAVDGFFGGGRRSVPARERTEFTSVEQRIVRKLLSCLFDELTEAWSPILPLKFEQISHSVNPAYTNIPGASEAEQMLVTVVNVALRGGEGAFHVLMPYAMLEPLRKQLHALIQPSAETEEEPFSQALMDGVADIELPISCSLVRTQITIETLLKLRAGDVLPVQMPPNVMLDVAGIPTYRGVYGTIGESHAVRVMSPAWK